MNRPHGLNPLPTPVKPIHLKMRVAIAPQLSDGCSHHAREAQHMPTPDFPGFTRVWRQGGKTQPQGGMDLGHGLIGCLSAGFHAPQSNCLAPKGTSSSPSSTKKTHRGLEGWQKIIQV